MIQSLTKGIIISNLKRIESTRLIILLSSSWLVKLGYSFRYLKSLLDSSTIVKVVISFIESPSN